jgi:hypothetical protein
MEARIGSAGSAKKASPFTKHSAQLTPKALEHKLIVINVLNFRTIEETVRVCASVD